MIPLLSSLCFNGKNSFSFLFIPLIQSLRIIAPFSSSLLLSKVILLQSSGWHYLCFLKCFLKIAPDTNLSFLNMGHWKHTSDSQWNSTSALCNGINTSLSLSKKSNTWYILQGLCLEKRKKKNPHTFQKCNNYEREPSNYSGIMWLWQNYASFFSHFPFIIIPCL